MVVFSVLLGACAAMRGAPSAETVLIDVVNENYFDVRVHAAYVGGQRRALGTIAGNGGHRRVDIPWEPKPLAFEAFLVTAGATYVSQPVDVTPGESVDVRIPQNIGASGFWHLRK